MIRDSNLPQGQSRRFFHEFRLLMLLFSGDGSKWTNVATTKPAFSFLDLPSEIRNQVYLPLLVRKDAIYRPWGLQARGVSRRDVKYGLFPQILRTCKLVNREASSLLYGSNTFCLSFYGLEKLLQAKCSLLNAQLIRRVDDELLRAFDWRGRLSLDGITIRRIREVLRVIGSVTRIGWFTLRVSEEAPPGRNQREDIRRVLPLGWKVFRATVLLDSRPIWCRDEDEDYFQQEQVLLAAPCEKVPCEVSH